MKNPILIFCIFLFAAISCDTFNQKDLFVGKWQGQSWTSGNKAELGDASQVHFEFMLDGTYTANYGQQLEKGTFRLDGNKLYTLETGKLEKMVKFKISPPDILLLEMNRGGQAEQLSLKKLSE